MSRSSAKYGQFKNSPTDSLKKVLEDTDLLSDGYMSLLEDFEDNSEDLYDRAVSATKGGTMAHLKSIMFDLSSMSLDMKQSELSANIHEIGARRIFEDMGMDTSWLDREKRDNSKSFYEILKDDPYGYYNDIIAKVKDESDENLKTLLTSLEYMCADREFRINYDHNNVRDAEETVAKEDMSHEQEQVHADDNNHRRHPDLSYDYAAKVIDDFSKSGRPSIPPFDYLSAVARNFKDIPDSGDGGPSTPDV